MRYDELAPLLLKQVQDLNRRDEERDRGVHAQDIKIEHLENQLEVLQAKLVKSETELMVAR